MPEIGWGALLIMDVLGFERMYRRPIGLSTIIRMFDDLQDVAATVGRRWLEGSAFEVRFFSDTVVMASFSDDESCTAQITHVGAVAEAAANLAHFAGDLKYPLAYRGALSCGQVGIRGNLLFGAAVHDAARHYELADGAMVFFTPTVARTWEECGALPDEIRDRLASVIVPTYRVPILGGFRYKTDVINPLFPARNGDLADDWRRRVLRSFDEPPHEARLDVIVKRQNTEHFLQRAFECREPFWRALDVP